MIFPLKYYYLVIFFSSQTFLFFFRRTICNINVINEIKKNKILQILPLFEVSS